MYVRVYYVYTIENYIRCETYKFVYNQIYE